MSTDIEIDDKTRINSGFSFELESSPTLMAGYHEDIIKQSDIIVKNAIGMIWAGIFLIVASFAVYAAGLTKTLVVGTISGSFIDVFSATILYLFNKTDKEKQAYFNNLTKMETYERFMGIIEDVKDENFKKEMITKMMNKSLK